ncbi:amidase [Mycobacterium tuberculosis]|nr:amidase [Mycobacterium tuberculosis]
MQRAEFVAAGSCRIGPLGDASGGVGSTVTIALSDALYVSIRERYSSTNSALDTFLAASTAS